MSTVILTDHIETPVGPMLLMVRGDRIIGLEFVDRPERYLKDLRHRFGEFEFRQTPDPRGFSGRLRAYFAGDIRALDQLPTEGGGTTFQERVWAELRRIPAGTTISYGALAERLGDRKATRAVGLANGRNPISVVVPCHRVIGTDGSLTGYGGGVPRKKWLLAHEGIASRKEMTKGQADLFSGGL